MKYEFEPSSISDVESASIADVIAELRFVTSVEIAESVYPLAAVSAELAYPDAVERAVVISPFV